MSRCNGTGFIVFEDGRAPCNSCRDCRPVPSPELPEGHALRDRLVDAFNCADGYWFSRHDVDAILRALATQGLTIVDAKERAVLEAMASVKRDALELARDAPGRMGNAVRAELARRERP
jgi:hypothetical protein